MDMSPYVRKTAANAITKLYRYSHLYIIQQHLQFASIGLRHAACVLVLLQVYFPLFYVISFVFAPSLDPDQKDALVEIIEKLLQDKTTVRSLYLIAILINQMQRLMFAFVKELYSLTSNSTSSPLLVVFVKMYSSFAEFSHLYLQILLLRLRDKKLMQLYSKF